MDQKKKIFLAQKNPLIYYRKQLKPKKCINDDSICMGNSFFSIWIKTYSLVNFKWQNLHNKKIQHLQQTSKDNKVIFTGCFNQKSLRSKRKLLSFHCPFSQQSAVTTQTKEIQKPEKCILGEARVTEQTILIKQDVFSFPLRVK